MIRQRQIQVSALLLSIATAGLSCADASRVTPTETDVENGIRQITLSGVPASSSGSIAFSAAQSAEAQDSVYLSLAPGTLPFVKTILVNNLSEPRAGLRIQLTDGGFDPVAFAASMGDSLQFTPVSNNGLDDPVIIKVPAKRPPSVVRSNPPKGRTDVATNVLITVIFTEPIDRNTITTNSLYLSRNGARVEGKLMLHAEPWIADFVPDGQLQTNATYELTVTNDVRDRDGEALAPSYSAQFLTGQKVCEPDESECQRGPISGLYSVGGVVTQMVGDVTVPVEGAELVARVELSDNTNYKISGIVTDNTGHYSIGSLPRGTVWLTALKPGLEQHCSVTDFTDSPTASATNIQLSTPGDFRGTQWRFGVSVNKYIEGHTYEWYGSTPYGPTIPGVLITIGVSDFVTAWALTDEAGYFSLCNGARVDGFIATYKVGYVPTRWNMGVVGGGTAYLGMSRSQ